MTAVSFQVGSVTTVTTDVTMRQQKAQPDGDPTGPEPPYPRQPEGGPVVNIMPPDPDGNNAPPPDPFWVAANATDTYWWLMTGMCGGCGRGDCHQLPCPSRPGVGFCLTCPTRRETGEVRG